MLKHTNIVRLFDIVETDKYIGVIVDYVPGGDLSDHIDKHGFFQEDKARSLFAQLISGIWYIHQREIVHRNLKLEKLLLDRNGDIIITDFGSANRFEHGPDDLMQTSCGSPCYAAPELVISEGLYVGSAVDIWSCGVILYAMLAGHLPFDDCPDGDDINVLYKYIVNTPLSFPDYVSRDARDLLGVMLQPNPLNRVDLKHVMQHRWLVPDAHLFDKSVEDLEADSIEFHKAKRQACLRQMRNFRAASEHLNVSRSQSAAEKGVLPHANVAAGPTRSHCHAPEGQTLYETSADVSAASQAQSRSRRGSSSTIMPTRPSRCVDDEPFAPSESPLVPIPVAPTAISEIAGSTTADAATIVTATQDSP